MYYYLGGEQLWPESLEILLFVGHPGNFPVVSPNYFSKLWAWFI